MIFLIIYVFCLATVVGIGVLAGWNDFKGMTIPNALSLAVAGVFPLAFAACHFGGVEFFSSFTGHLISAVIVFAVSFVMFSLRIMGGGDSKMMTAYALWFDPQLVLVFIMYVTIMGGLFGLLALVFRKRTIFKNAPKGSWVARLQAGESVVAYGIPIALGAISSFLVLGYAAPELLSQFLLQEP